MIFRNIKFAWKSLVEGEMKSLLSIISITISVVTLISILSISQSLSQYIKNQFGMVGSNLMWVESDGSYANSDLGIQTSQNIGNLSFVDSVSPDYMTTDIIHEGNDSGSVAVCGVNNDFAAITNLAITGQFISDKDCNNHNAVCVISDDVRKKYVYHDQNPLGQQIKISGMYYTIIGYVNPSELDATGFASSIEQANSIYIPYTVFQNSYSKSPLNSIVFQVQDTKNIKQYKNQIDGFLSTGINKGICYNVNSIADSMENWFHMIDKVNIFFIIFIAITLLISGIGIMNVMMMSTMEKKWEIGLRESIGASGMDILLQFIIEILILSIIGVILGVFGGVFIITVIRFYEEAISVSMHAVILSILFCFAISFIFGLIPAVKASKLLPLECLEK